MPEAKPHIQVHDFAGHPFQADLSRELARRGFDVDHVFSAQYSSGKGRLRRETGDPAGLRFTPIEVDADFDKYSAIGRIRYERAYAKAWVRHVQASRPDCVIACNVPLLTLNSFRGWAAKTGQRWILWHQDIFSRAMGDELDRRFGTTLAAAGRRYFTSRERLAVSSASRVIAIGEEFRRLYDAWNIDPAGIEIIPNWAPVDDIKPTEPDNAWALDNLGTRGDLRLVYTGTLGRKHNPQLLVDLLDGIAAGPRTADLVVVSEGEGADHIAAAATGRPEARITVLPFQDVRDLPAVMGSGDVLVAILEPEASKFSIPSKVLSYMAAGRPILGLMPDDNPAAADILAAGGFVATPDAAGVTTSISWLSGLIDDPERRIRIGAQARLLAEEKFGVEPITDRFVAVISASAQNT